MSSKPLTDDAFWALVDAVSRTNPGKNHQVVQSFMAQKWDASGFDAHGQTFLSLAVRNGLPESVLQALLDCGALINQANQDDSRDTALIATIKEPWLWQHYPDRIDPILAWLIAQGADVGQVDAYGMSALFHAVALGRPEMVSKLLGWGAQPDQQTPHGRTPLHHLGLEWLSSVGGSVGAWDVADEAGEGCALTHAYDTARYLRIMALLLDAGADINHQDHFGWTPLAMAIQFQATPLALALIQAQSDVHKPLDCGLSPIHLAAIHRDEAVWQALLAAGAHPETPIAAPGMEPYLTGITAMQLRNQSEPG